MLFDQPCIALVRLNRGGRRPFLRHIELQSSLFMQARPGRQRAVIYCIENASGSKMLEGSNLLFSASSLLQCNEVSASQAKLTDLFSNSHRHHLYFRSFRSTVWNLPLAGVDLFAASFFSSGKLSLFLKRSG